MAVNSLPPHKDWLILLHPGYPAHCPTVPICPVFILHCYRKCFGKKIKGYLTNDAVVVATESRTSSPVRIPRDNESLQHPHIKNLYPCGEGAGYAGGIVSAAMDGERIAGQIAVTWVRI